MRIGEFFNDGVFVLGGAAAVWGVYMISAPAGRIVGGLGAMTIAWLSAGATAPEALGEPNRAVSPKNSASSADRKRPNLDAEGWEERPPVTTRADRLRFRQESGGGVPQVAWQQGGDEP